MSGAQRTLASTMADTRTPEQRRRIMQSVGQKNTGPELAVRKMLHRLGYRYVLNDSRLPGRPDLVFPRCRKVIFIHGCFWHGHGCAKGKLPKSRLEYWEPKIRGNKQRDASSARAIRRLNWDVLTVWQCQVRRPDKILPRLIRFLESN